MTDLIAIQKIAGWEKLKTLVLDSVSSPITKRVYNMALDEFMGWFQQAPRPGFTKATVSAWRVSLVMAGLGGVIQREGLFCARYSDPASHFFVTPRAGEPVDKSRLTQVGRALK